MRTGFAILGLFGLAAACASLDADSCGSDRDCPVGEFCQTASGVCLPRSDAGGEADAVPDAFCEAVACTADCRSRGYSDGLCVGSTCQCAGTPVDAGTEDAGEAADGDSGSEADASCDPAACLASCAAFGMIGECAGSGCNCREDPDAGTEDAGVEDVGPEDVGPEDAGCPPGTSPCGDECVDLTRDPLNCGRCFNVCGRDAACVDSGCVSIPADTPVTFPSSASLTGGPSGAGVLGTGGGGVRYQSGDFVEETFARTTPVTQLDVDFTMSDHTSSGCGGGTTLSWAVRVNGADVGSYSWLQGTGAGDRHVVQTFSFGAIAPVAGTVTLRFEATTTVCPGDGSWNWYPGGTATLR